MKTLIPVSLSPLWHIGHSLFRILSRHISYHWLNWQVLALGHFLSHRTIQTDLCALKPVYVETLIPHLTVFEGRNLTTVVITVAIRGRVPSWQNVWTGTLVKDEASRTALPFFPMRRQGRVSAWGRESTTLKGQWGLLWYSCRTMESFSMGKPPRLWHSVMSARAQSHQSHSWTGSPGALLLLQGLC